MSLPKFRVFDKKNKEMGQVTNVSFENEVVKRTNGYDDNEEWFAFNNVFFMQFSTMKDINGNLICEDDIIKIIHMDPNREPELMRVRFDGVAFYVATTPSAIDELAEDLEVVGNIYEHPHLLESE